MIQQWKEISFKEAIDFIIKKSNLTYEISISYDTPKAAPAQLIEFSDGTVIACVSDYIGLSGELNQPIWYVHQ